MGTWNMTSLVMKEPDIVHEAETHWLVLEASGVDEIHSVFLKASDVVELSWLTYLGTLDGELGLADRR